MSTNKKQILQPKSKIILDQLGQYYATVNCEKNSGTFSITAHLKEKINTNALQQAVNEIVKRLPHLNVKLESDFFWYYHEVLESPLKIIPETKFLAPAKYFKKDEPLTRVTYSENHFTMEVLHTVCDGRSLSKIIVSLLTEYFEILGCEVRNKNGIIDCKALMKSEEVENAYQRYADFSKSKQEKETDVYNPKHEVAEPKTIIQPFDLDMLKTKARNHGVTITEYILAHIVTEFSVLRDKDGCKKTITANIPIDCRSFFKSESLRNFVSNKIISMPENSSFTEVAHGIRKQLSEVNADYIQAKISEMEKLIRLGKYIPLFIKKWLIKKIGKAESIGNSTGLSNLGLIKLPEEISKRIEMFSFSLGAEPNMPYQFGCVATGNILTLTATTSAKDNEVVEDIFSALK